MQQPLYFKENGLKLEKRGGSILAVTKEEKRFFPLTAVASLRLDGAIHLSQPLFNELASRRILVHYYSYGGKYKGTFCPAEKNVGKVRLYQYKTYFDEPKRLGLVKSIIISASKNKITLLKRFQKKNDDENLLRNIDSISELIKKLKDAADVKAARGFEGMIAKHYFDCFSVIFKNYVFDGRNRNPPQDEINCLLSWGNTLLYDEVYNACFEVGVDLHCGFLHEMEGCKPALVLDIAESLRQPIIDSLIFEVVNNNMLKDYHFNKKENFCFLSNYGKSLFFRKYDFKMKKTFLNRKTGGHESYRNSIKLDVYKLVKYFFGESDFFEGLRIF